MKHKRRIIIPDNFSINKVNELLANGKQTKDIAKYFGLGYDSFRKIIDAKGYEFNKVMWRYTPVPEEESVNYLSEIRNAGIPQGIATLIENQDRLINVLNYQDQLQELLDNQDALLQMLHMYQKNSSMMDPTIKIEMETTETLTKTLRLNKKIYEEFEQFCKDHDQYRKMDLYSAALKEYMELHI